MAPANVKQTTRENHGLQEGVDFVPATTEDILHDQAMRDLQDAEPLTTSLQ